MVEPAWVQSRNNRRIAAAAFAAVTTLSMLVTGVATAGSGPAAAAAPAAAAPGGRLDGFTPASSVRELRAEQRFMTYPSATLARSLDQRLAKHTGLVGTTNYRRRARQIVSELRSYGLRPHVSTFYVYLSVPRRVSLTMTSPVRFHAANKERCRSVETDCADTVVGYNALSPSGDVTAPVVYVNYGTTDDYATLAGQGVSVKGKIVLARYGKVFRGVKTNLAAEHGAKGVVIYSDPADDGNVKGPVYPDGPWRAPDGIQRLMRRAVGPHRAERLLVSGELVESAQALAWGLVDELTGIDGVPTRALAWLEQLLQLPRQPVLATRAIARADLVEALHPDNIGLDHFVDAWNDPDTQAGLRALVAKLGK